MATGVLGGAPLRREKLRALLLLRARLTVRLFAAEQSRLVLIFMLIIGVLPLMVGIGIGTAVGYLQAPDPWPGRILAIVLVVLWLLWMFIPLIAFTLNESMDITRLLVYPLSRSELVATMLLGTLFDIPTYIMLPLFIAIVAGWAASPALLILLPALLLAYVQMVLSSQILLTALGGVLASRRLRDILIILGALLGSSCYLFQRAAFELFERYIEPGQLGAIPVVAILRWLPAGNQAQAIISASQGDFGNALLWLGVGLLASLLLAWVWWQLTFRLVTGEGFALSGLPQRQPKAEAKKARSGARGVAGLLDWLPADLQQLVLKELRLVWRTPQRRVGLLQGILIPLIFLGYAALGGGIPDELPAFLGFIPPLFAIFTTWIAAQNALGVEEKGLPLLSLTPLPRERFWLGKGLATAPMIIAPTLLLAVLAIIFIPGWQSIAGMLAIPGVTLASMAVVNIGSIFFAYPVRTDGKSVRNSSKGGCIAGLGNGFIMPAALSMVNTPPALFMIGAQLLSQPWLGYVGALFALAYGAALFYGVGVRLAGRLMLAREAELLVATRPVQGE